MEPKAINRENLFDLLWVNYSRLIGEGYSEKPLEWVKLFRAVDSTGAYEKYKEINGLPVWEKNQEGQPYNQVERSTGFDITIINERFDQSYKITWEYMEDNKEKIMNGKGIGLNGATKMGRGCRVAQELTCAKIINGGFDNVGYDGVPLFATNHPLQNGTFANTPVNEEDKKLTNDNVEKAVQASKGQPDNLGMKIQVKPTEMFVASNLYMTACRIMNSVLVAGTQLNDKNVISLVSPLTVHEMSYFDDGIWILKDPSIENLIFQWREHPEFGYDNIQGTADYMVWGRARWGAGYIDWRGLYGAKQSA